MKNEKDYFEIRMSTLQSLAAWAAECAEKALPVFNNLMTDDRLENAIMGAKEFSESGNRTNRLRKLAMDAHRASQEIKDPAASAAAKSASLAASCAFTHPYRDIRQAVHILGPAAYSALAIELQNEGHQETGDREINRAIRKANDDIVNLLDQYPERSEGKNRIEQILFLLDSGIRKKNRI